MNDTSAVSPSDGSAGETAMAHKSVYDSVAVEYERKAPLHHAATTQQVRRFKEFLPDQASVLDIGCAVGLALSIMIEQGMQATGVDLSAEMVRYARLRSPESRVLHGDFLSMVISDKYDGVFAQSVIHLFPPKELECLFAKIRAALVPRGVLLVSTTESDRDFAEWAPKRDYATSLLRYRRHWSRAEFSRMIAREGFSVVSEWNLIDVFAKQWMVYVARLNSPV